MTKEPIMSDDAYRLIHSALAGWIEGACADGFDGDPWDIDQDRAYAEQLMRAAAWMREIEAHTNISQ